MHRVDYPKIIVEKGALNDNFVLILKHLMYWKIIIWIEIYAER